MTRGGPSIGGLGVGMVTTRVVSSDSEASEVLIGSYSDWTGNVVVMARTKDGPLRSETVDAARLASGTIDSPTKLTWQEMAVAIAFAARQHAIRQVRDKLKEL